MNGEWSKCLNQFYGDEEGSEIPLLKHFSPLISIPWLLITNFIKFDFSYLPLWLKDFGKLQNQ